jgi:NAD(P)-dependent dehydrogenase (short-subunit alcohol dehydrogenase family)
LPLAERRRIGQLECLMIAEIPASIPRAALITGGSHRIGRAIAHALADLGLDLAIHYHASRDAAEFTCAEVARSGRRAVALRADLADESQVATLLQRATVTLGPIGVLVNNASLFERDEWFDATRASWDAHIEPGLRAPFVLMQQFAKALPETAEGVVINMLDQRVWSLTPHFVSYTVAKAGLWALTQSMALALAPRIRVNGIGPGPALPSPRQTSEQFARQCASTPLRRGTSPDEIARAVVAILTLPAMTGQMLALDGGQHMQWQSGRHGPPPEE